MTEPKRDDMRARKAGFGRGEAGTFDAVKLAYVRSANLAATRAESALLNDPRRGSAGRDDGLTLEQLCALWPNED